MQIGVLHFLCFFPPRDDVPFGIDQEAGVPNLLTYLHGYADGLINSGDARDGAKPVMPRDKFEVECYGDDELAEHYVAYWLVRYSTKVIAQEETHATTLLDNHTPKEE